MKINMPIVTGVGFVCFFVGAIVGDAGNQHEAYTIGLGHVFVAIALFGVPLLCGFLGGVEYQQDRERE